MLTKGEEYTDQGQDYYEERYRQRVGRSRYCGEMLPINLIQSHNSSSPRKGFFVL